jgi:hypothetical protein
VGICVSGGTPVGCCVIAVVGNVCVAEGEVVHADNIAEATNAMAKSIVKYIYFFMAFLP